MNIFAKFIVASASLTPAQRCFWPRSPLQFRFSWTSPPMSLSFGKWSSSYVSNRSSVFFFHLSNNFVNDRCSLYAICLFLNFFYFFPNTCIVSSFAPSLFQVFRSICWCYYSHQLLPDRLTASSFSYPTKEVFIPLSSNWKAFRSFCQYLASIFKPIIPNIRIELWGGSFFLLELVGAHLSLPL